jgi:hypothetical protein
MIVDSKEAANMLGSVNNPNAGARVADAVQKWLLDTRWQPWALFLIASGIGAAVALVGHYLLATGLMRIAKRSNSPAGVLAVSRLSQPVRWLMVVSAILFVVNDLHIPGDSGTLLEHGPGGPANRIHTANSHR